MSYSLRSKGRAPMTHTPPVAEKTRRKSSRRLLQSEETPSVETPSGASDSEEHSSQLLSPSGEATLTAFIEESWKSGVADLIKEAEDEMEENLIPLGDETTVKTPDAEAVNDPVVEDEKGETTARLEVIVLDSEDEVNIKDDEKHRPTEKSPSKTNNSPRKSDIVEYEIPSSPDVIEEKSPPSDIDVDMGEDVEPLYDTLASCDSVQPVPNPTLSLNPEGDNELPVTKPIIADSSAMGIINDYGAENEIDSSISKDSQIVSEKDENLNLWHKMNEPGLTKVPIDPSATGKINEKELRATNYNESLCPTDMDVGDEEAEAQRLADLLKDPEEAALESLVFGDDGEILDEFEKKEPSLKQISGDDMDQEPAAAWLDEDDEEAEISAKDPRHRKCFRRKGGDPNAVVKGPALKKKLKREFEKVMGEAPSWAQPSKRNKTDPDSDDEASNLAMRAGSFVKTTKPKSLSFAQGLLDFKKCRRVNSQQPGRKIKRIQFHPTSQVMMSAGLDQILRLYQIDGVDNPLIQSVAFEKFSIHSAAFTVDGSSVVLTCNKPWFKIYDLIGGNTTHVPVLKKQLSLKKFRLTPDGKSAAFLAPYGYVHVMDLSSKEISSSVKMNGAVKSVSFIQRSGLPRLLTHGEGGDVYVWDVRNTSACLHRFADDGCNEGSAVGVSCDSSLIACGSANGILNVYDAAAALSQRYPTPKKTFKNLLTTIHDIKFNHSGEIMCFASGEGAGSVRLAHVPTLNVFANFPPVGLVMGNPRDVDFSPHSGYFAVADSKDKIHLNRLNYYDNF